MRGQRRLQVRSKVAWWFLNIASFVLAFLITIAVNWYFLDRR